MVKNLEMDPSDFTFSTSEDVQNRHPYGFAKSCQSPPYVPDARFLINLTGTSFTIDESVSLKSSSSKNWSLKWTIIITVTLNRHGKFNATVTTAMKQAVWTRPCKCTCICIKLQTIHQGSSSQYRQYCFTGYVSCAWLARSSSSAPSGCIRKPKRSRLYRCSRVWRMFCGITNTSPVQR